MQITLNDVEQELCKMVAGLRQKMSRAAGHTNTPYGQTQDEIDINGYGAELAFCKMFNLYPDFTYHARSGTADALSRKGYRIDVKDTTYENGHLLIKKSKKHGEADMYVLMVGKFPSYRFAGFAYENEVLKEENLKDFGNYNQPGYALNQSQLHQIGELNG